MTLQLAALIAAVALAAGSTGRLAYEHHALRAAQIIATRAIRWAGATSHVPLFAPHGGRHITRRTA